MWYRAGVCTGPCNYISLMLSCKIERTLSIEEAKPTLALNEAFLSRTPLGRPGKFDAEPSVDLAWSLFLPLSLHRFVLQRDKRVCDRALKLFTQQNNRKVVKDIRKGTSSSKAKLSQQ
jgi:hypothetical protein